MAERPTEFSNRNIQLYKSESLGSGSYGGVCKAKCDRILCAAKIMHPTLLDLHDPGTASYLRKFREECHLLSLARYPNVVQYLGIYTDPITRPPVLLIELCNESLTSFLERSSGPLSYHVQVNICNDIALALEYLHSNRLIHRDLTGNNVLMIAGTRAKITDFGMSKLASVNPRMTALTLCPGNVLYMSPEALDEAKSYTAKLDVFSFAVIVIQILTRQFPSPTDRFRLVSVPQFKAPLRQGVPETERRKAHLLLILAEADSLKLLALQCLNKKENKRPSALQLCERLSELKQSSQYRESREQAEHSSEIQQLQLQLRGKTQEGREQQTQITELENNNRRQLMVKDRQLQHGIASRDQALEGKERELQQAQQLESEFQESLQQKYKTITELQRTISEYERKIQQLEQGDTASRDTPPQQEPAEKDISKMEWRKGKNAPQDMWRGAAVVHGNTAYFKQASSKKIYSYKNISGKETWHQLEDNPNRYCGLAVVDGLLTSVGGWSTDNPTNTLLSLSDGKKQWSSIFPAMPTPRSHIACINTGEALVVAGGREAKGVTDSVEVMAISTKIWTTVFSLPQKCSSLSSSLCGHTLYFAGGDMGSHTLSKTVLTCNITHLLHHTKPEKHRVINMWGSNVWRNVSSLPVTQSTLVSFSGYLLAIGGRDDSDKPTSHVHRYDSHTDSWTLASMMKNKQTSCLVVAYPDCHLTVVGEYTLNTTDPNVDSPDDQPMLCNNLRLAVRREDTTDTHLFHHSILFHAMATLIPDRELQLGDVYDDRKRPYLRLGDAKQAMATVTWDSIPELQLGDIYDDRKRPYHRPREALFDSDNLVPPMSWIKGDSPPELMLRGAATVHGDTAYIIPANSHQVYSYQIIFGKEKWSKLPDIPNENCSLVILKGFLTTVGGEQNGSTNILLSLKANDVWWYKVFPPMPTPRARAACVTTDKALVVAGGWVATDDMTDIVEIMDTYSLTWANISSLPRKFTSLSATICRDTLYLAGGLTEDFLPTKSVFTCVLSDSLISSAFSGNNVWKEIVCLPVTSSSLISYGGHILAIGGEDEGESTSNVYRYDCQTNSWTVISEMKDSQTSCLVIPFPHGHITVVGGFSVNTTVRSLATKPTDSQQQSLNLSEPVFQYTASRHLAFSHYEIFLKKGKNAPEAMLRGGAVVLGNIAYLRPKYSYRIYSYQNINGKEKWSQLPDNPNMNCGLAVVDGLLTSVGGWNKDRPTNILLSFTVKGNRKEWCEIYPPMPKPRTCFLFLC